MVRRPLCLSSSGATDAEVPGFGHPQREVVKSPDVLASRVCGVTVTLTRGARGICHCFPHFFFFTLNLPQRQSSPMKTLWFRHADTWHPTGLRSQLLSLETAVFQAPRLEGGLPPSRRGGVRVCSVPGSGSASGAPRHGQGAVGRRSRAGRAHRASAGFPSCRRMPRPSLRGTPGSRGLGEELVDECTVKREAGKTVKAGESGGCRSAVASWAQLTASSQVQKDP